MRGRVIEKAFAIIKFSFGYSMKKYGKEISDFFIGLLLTNGIKYLIVILC